MAEKAGDQNDQEAFFEELDSFQLNMPGGKTVDFCETDVLLNMVHKQYPRWKEMGSVTSIPTARVPKLFLHNQQITKELEKMLKSLQKGDGAEKNLFRLFVESSFQEQPGVVIFPNLDGSHIFKKQVAKVEIDMVLIHQSKGIFVFNVKNETGKGTTQKKIKEDIEKHNRFIRLLMTYKNRTGTQKIPIHTVVCNFADASKKFFNLEQDSRNEANKTLVFSKNTLKPEIFSKDWIVKIDKMEDVKWDVRLETLVARLVALNSIEGSLSLIHNQMTRNLLQSVSKQEHLEAQMSTPDQKNEQFKPMVAKNSEITDRKGKKKFILWTKDQMSIISRVYEHLTDPSSEKGLRLLVTGCKGSGKTMLLTFIANLSLSLFKLQCEENLEGKILVCDGSFRSPLLVALLRSALTSTDITLYSLPITRDEFYSRKNFDGDSLAPLRKEFLDQLQKAEILLCDEFSLQNHDYLLGDLREDQHCVLFTSEKNYEIGSEYDVIHLGASLRSTCRIAKFADSWIKTAYLGLYEFECKPAHNFEGENIDFTFVKDISSDSIVNRINYVAQCVNVICEHAEKSTGLEVIPVVPLVDPENKKMIVENLTAKGYTCYEPSFEINNDDSERYIPIRNADKNTSSYSSSILFIDGLDIEGCEFGAVLVLHRLKDASQIPTALGKIVFTAITRATIKVAIVLDDVTSFKETSHYDWYERATGRLQHTLTFALKKQNSKPSVIVVGTKPNIPGFRRQDSGSCEQVPEIEGISVYVGEQGCFLHIDDVYKESDLQKLLNYGIKIVLVFNQYKSPWLYMFYYSSSISFQHFSAKNGDCYYVRYFDNSDDKKIDESICLVSFCVEQSGIPGLVKPDKIRLPFPFKVPETEGDIFSWDKWKAKGTENYRLEQYNYAADRYIDSILLLQRHYNKLITQSVINLKAAIKARRELAKLHTNLALICIKLYERPNKNQMEFRKRLHYAKDFGPSFEKCMKSSFEHAMNAIVWNASWERGFERAKSVITKIREHYTEKESSFGQIEDMTLEEIITEAEFEIMVTSYFDYKKIAFNLPASFEAKLDELDHMRFDYRLKKQSLTFAQLIPLRKQISGFGKMLAQEILGLVPKRLVETEINFVDIEKTRCEAKQVFDYCILLILEALYWNPLAKDCYGILDQALQRLEDVLDHLKAMDDSLVEERYLVEITLSDIKMYTNQQFLTKRFEF